MHDIKTPKRANRYTSEMAELNRGHAIMDQLRANMNKIEESGQYLTEMQQDWLNVSIESYLPEIYGNAWKNYEHEILGYNNAKKSSFKIIAFTAPPNYGKTHFLVILCCLVFTSIPKGEILIVSNENIVTQMRIVSMLKRVFKLNLSTSNTRCITHTFPDGERKIKIHCLHGGNALRGEPTPNFLIMDEANSISRNTLDNIIPLLIEKKCRTITVSETGAASNNGYSRLLTSEYVDVHTTSPGCQACSTSGIICEHNIVPEWTGGDNADLIRSILGNEN